MGTWDDEGRPAPGASVWLRTWLSVGAKAPRPRHLSHGTSLTQQFQSYSDLDLECQDGDMGH